jgi:Fe2+ transport system protein FeoA
MVTRHTIRSASPGEDGNERETVAETRVGEQKTVAEMQAGEEGTITQVDGRIHALASAMGIRPGMRLVVESKQPLGGPVVVTVGKSTTSLGLGYAREIQVVDEHWGRER